MGGWKGEEEPREKKAPRPLGGEGGHPFALFLCRLFFVFCHSFLVVGIGDFAGVADDDKPALAVGCGTDVGVGVSEGAVIYLRPCYAVRRIGYLAGSPA
jgi:hypothetical protein